MEKSYRTKYSFELDNIEFKEDSKLVVKKSRLTHPNGLKHFGSFMKDVINRPDPTIVRVFDFKELGRDQHWHVYTYTMEELLSLSDADEHAVDRFITEPENISNIKLRKFLTKIWNNGYRDVHSGNVMKDNKNNYKVIDLEGFFW